MSRHYPLTSSVSIARRVVIAMRASRPYNCLAKLAARYPQCFTTNPEECRLPWSIVRACSEQKAREQGYDDLINLVHRCNDVLHIFGLPGVLQWQDDQESCSNHDPCVPEEIWSPLAGTIPG